MSLRTLWCVFSFVWFFSLLLYSLKYSIQFFSTFFYNGSQWENLQDFLLISLNNFNILSARKTIQPFKEVRTSLAFWYLLQFFNYRSLSFMVILDISQSLFIWMKSGWGGSYYSSTLTLSTDSPQGCVLSPLLYALYTSPLQQDNH